MSIRAQEHTPVKTSRAKLTLENNHVMMFLHAINFRVILPLEKGPAFDLCRVQELLNIQLLEIPHAKVEVLAARATHF
jgi:hypothetical protein